MQSYCNLYLCLDECVCVVVYWCVVLWKREIIVMSGQNLEKCTTKSAKLWEHKRIHTTLIY